ncbi:MAG: DUF1043 family protein [Xanthomonadales bacterium]|nr:DUF1043 family protein [Xanthomonadales bacterium]
MDTGLIIVLTAFGGLLVGAVGMYFFLSAGATTGGDQELRKEFDAYREEVADHFAKTASLVNRLTDSYKDVFEHLQDGAHGLLDEEQLRARLQDESGETITLTRLGYRGEDAGEKSESDSDQDKETSAEQPVDYDREPPEKS